jgi:hypothetical protein
MPATIEYRGRRIPLTRSDANEAAAILDSLRGYTDADLERVKAHTGCLTYHVRRLFEAAHDGDETACAVIRAAGVQHYA